MLILFRIKQQVLWLFEIMIVTPKARHRVHLSASCMKLIKLAIDTRESLISSTGTSVKVGEGR